MQHRVHHYEGHKQTLCKYLKSVRAQRSSRCLGPPWALLFFGSGERFAVPRFMHFIPAAWRYLSTRRMVYNALEGRLDAGDPVARLECLRRSPAKSRRFLAVVVLNG